MSTVTRQAKNISKIVVRARHWRRSDDGLQQRGQNGTDGNGSGPPGNFTYHSKNCKACQHMSDNLTKYKSSKTGRQDHITRHYTCQSRYITYLITCRLCRTQSQYVGQSVQTMAQRHYGHRSEIKRGEAGLGRHFHDHAVDLGIDLNHANGVDRITEMLDLVIIGSVEEGKRDSLVRLDRLEEDFQHRLMTMDWQGGINIRDETKRRRKN